MEEDLGMPIILLIMIKQLDLNL